MEPLYSMSQRELDRLRALEAYAAGGLSQAELARRLSLSLRQVKRLIRAYRSSGLAGITSKRRGRPSNNRIDPALLARAIDLVREHYADFGPTFAAEKLAELHGITVKRERLRQAMIAAELHQPKRRRVRNVHPPRERRPQRGELVQGDGSPHDWFEGRGPHCSLLIFIDDATSAIGAGHFALHESTESYFALIAAYLRSHGKPCALYVDKLSVFKQSRAIHGEQLTQFARAMNELDIELICANSPQAKGRVERANRTLQNRLVKELRLAKINSIDEANAFLPTFLARFNQRFAVPPRCPTDAHRPLAAGDDLERILVSVEERVVSKNLTLKFNGVLYQISAPGRERRLQHRRVLVRERADVMTIELNGEPLEFRPVARDVTPVVDAKTLNATVDRARLGPRQPNPKKQRPIPANHPWHTPVRRAPNNLA
jgi:transposase